MRILVNKSMSQVCSLGSQNWQEVLEKASYRGYDITLLATAMEGKEAESLCFNEKTGEIYSEGKLIVNLHQIIKSAQENKASPELQQKVSEGYQEENTKKIEKIASILTKTINRTLHSEIPIKTIPQTLNYEGKNFEEDISAFAAHCLCQPKEQLTIKKVKPGLTSGATGAPVLTVFNKSDDTLMCVIKSNNSATAQKEIDALMLLGNMSFNNVQFPSLLGIATSGNQTMVAQSTAPGQSLADEMKNAGQTLEFEALRTGISKAALGIAELHEKKGASSPQVNSSERTALTNSYKSNLSEYLQFINKNGVLNPKELKILEDKIKDIQFSPIGNFIHHDFHPGNVFFDGKAITIIDNDGVSKTPSGVGSYDAIYFYYWIAIQGMMSGLPEKKIEELQNLFLTEYTKHSTNKNIDKELEFMKIYIPAKYIIELNLVLTTPNHPWLNSLGKETIEKLIAHLINNLTTTAR